MYVSEEKRHVDTILPGENICRGFILKRTFLGNPRSIEYSTAHIHNIQQKQNI